VDGSLSNLIIEIHWIIFRCTHFSSSFRKRAGTLPRGYAEDSVLLLCLDQYHHNRRRRALLIRTLVVLKYVIEPSVFRWQVADGECCKREEGNKVLGLLNIIKFSMINHKNRSVGILLKGGEHQDDTIVSFEECCNPKHPDGIAIKIKEMFLTTWTEIPESKGQCWFTVLIRVHCSSILGQNPTSQQKDWYALC